VNPEKTRHQIGRIAKISIQDDLGFYLELDRSEGGLGGKKHKPVFHKLSVSSPRPPPPEGSAPGTPHSTELRLKAPLRAAPPRRSAGDDGQSVTGFNTLSDGKNNLRRREFIIFAGQEAVLALVEASVE